MSDVLLPTNDAGPADQPNRRTNAGHFKPGKSGNPSGRPVKKIEERSIIEEALLDPVEVTIKGKKTSVPTVSAILMVVKQKALRGDLKSAQWLLKECPRELLDQINRSTSEQKELDKKKREFFLESMDNDTLMAIRTATVKVAEAFPAGPKRPPKRK